MLEEVLKQYHVDPQAISMYGSKKAKIDFEKVTSNKDGKLILVTSISPTPYGEGKTTMSIGLQDAMRKLDKKSIVVLREPSLGPVFGRKGGATGGGKCNIVPEQDINFHFNGDFHAITTCNNFICSVIDNSIYYGNPLEIDLDTISFHRCMDLNDRALRNVELDLGKGKKRKEKFLITAASEMMAIFCLSRDYEDLRRRIENIYIGKSIHGKELFVKDLNCVDACLLLLKDALKPNAVLTSEGNLALVHGGPFANIAHGCNSFIATSLGLKLADYVITEAGFGSDLGAVKFLDMKCRLGLEPSAIVLNATIRSLKYNSGWSEDEIQNKPLESLQAGIGNLEFHIHNMADFTNNLVVVLNHFYEDTDEEVAFVKEYVEKQNIPFVVSTAYQDGGKGSIALANKVLELCEKPTELPYLYELQEPLIDKIGKVLHHLGAAEIDISAVEAKISEIQNSPFAHFPVCISKTPFSITDDPKVLGYPKDFIVKVTDIQVFSGAEFIVVYLGGVITMPGLNKDANYLSMKFEK